MKQSISLLFIFLSVSLFGQSASIEKEAMDSIYNEALLRRTDLVISSSYQYIELNDYTRVIREDFKIPNYKFLEKEELIRITIKQKKSLAVHRVAHKFISPDTIDINFGVLELTAKRKIHFNKGLKTVKASFVLDCGGTGEYKPGIRFVKDTEESIWKVAKNNYLIEE